MKTINVNTVATEVKNNVVEGVIYIIPNKAFNLSEEVEHLVNAFKNAHPFATRKEIEKESNDIFDYVERMYGSKLKDNVRLLKEDLGIELQHPGDETWIQVCASSTESENFSNCIMELGRTGFGQGRQFVDMIPLSLAEKMQEGVEMDFGKFKLTPRQRERVGQPTWEERLMDVLD